MSAKTLRVHPGHLRRGAEWSSHVPPEVGQMDVPCSQPGSPKPACPGACRALSGCVPVGRRAAGHSLCSPGLFELRQLALEVLAEEGQMPMLTASREGYSLFGEKSPAQSTGMVRHATAGSRKDGAVLQGRLSTWIWCSRSWCSLGRSA